MAELNIEIEEGIHAEIVGGDKTGLPYVPIILDPISNSYSTLGILNSYQMLIQNINGLINPSLLHNGKNSRFTAGGTGTCDIRLRIEDDQGNTDEITIIITIL